MGGDGPFGSHAWKYLDAGLRVFPAGGEDGKRPLIKNWPRVGRRAAGQLMQRFATANIAIIDGDDGGITRIDIDDPGLAEDAIRRFGETPIKVGTPSSGVHLWYRANGERRILRLEGAAIDVLGKGGYGIAPPSVAPQRGAYAFLEGSPDLIGKLPTIRPDALPRETPKRLEPNVKAVTAKPWQEMISGDGRNSCLFAEARARAGDSETAVELESKIAVLNQEFAEPLSPTEVKRIARSVMRYKREGRLLLPGCEAHAFVTPSELKRLGGNGDAVLLLLRLRVAHGWRQGAEFALANAYAASFLWSIGRFRKARDFLVDHGFIARIHEGGRGPHDPPRFRLT
jgi:hypothetical protein